VHAPKRFSSWILVKEKLDALDRKPPFVDERDVWWASFGENIGTEINGKSGLFSRPCLIFKKLNHEQFLIIPLTSKPKVGMWYLEIKLRDRPGTLCLHQIRMMHHKRLLSRIGQVSKITQRSIKEHFANLYL